MTINVGDTVRITQNSIGSRNGIGDVGLVVNIIGEEYKVHVEGGPKEFNWHQLSDLELVTEPVVASGLCKENMEAHMAKGRYVQAIKWAQLAELAKELENEE